MSRKVHEPVNNADAERLVAEQIEDSEPQRVGECMVSPALLNEILFFRNMPGEKFNSSQMFNGLKAHIGIHGRSLFGSGFSRAATGTF